MDLINLGSRSFLGWCQLIGHGELHLEREHLGRVYQIERGGQYRVFRDSLSLRRYSDPDVTLVVGFRLKLIGSNRLMHWLFQRLCILTTPFWCGFRGFKIKLWLVNPKTKDYLGIYRWSGQANAQAYVSALERVLKAVSVAGSVWHQIVAAPGFEDYLMARSVNHK